MKLSILIPTHNRPTLFPRCLKSILDQITDDMEIIVNNDSNDITEIDHPQVTYHYNKFDNLSLVYKFLLDQSCGEYVYFLEDDDYVVNDFTSIPLDADLIGGNYYPTYHNSHILSYTRLYTDAVYNSNDFVNQTDLGKLQLSQFVFKRDCIKDFEFPMDSNIHNDIKLVMHAALHSTKIRTLRKVLYYQTIDGRDNISFPHLHPIK